MKISNPWKKENSQRQTREGKAESSREYAGVVIRNLTLPIKKAVKKGGDAARSANEALKYDSSWAKPIIVPLAATAGAAYGAGVGTASALKRGFKGAKNLKDNEALKKLGTGIKNTPSNMKKTAGEQFNKLREGVKNIAPDISGTISNAFSNINLSQ